MSELVHLFNPNPPERAPSPCSLLHAKRKQFTEQCGSQARPDRNAWVECFEVSGTSRPRCLSSARYLRFQLYPGT